MTPEISLYLDIVRFLAAMIVFLGHVSGHRFTGGFLWQIAPFMGEAVAIFFVLSGFVIGFATDRRETTARAYVIARAARVYSVALPALVTTFVLDAIGRTVQPALYSAEWGYSAEGPLGQFLAGLFFTNNLWFLDVPQGSDLPFWSLGFEVWYYVLFGLALFVPKRWRALSIVLTLVFVGPRIAIMFPLWLLGLGGYHLCARRRFRPVVGAMLFALSSACWIGWEFMSHWHDPIAALVPVALKRPELIQDYLVSLCFLGQLIGFRAMGGWFAPILARLARPIRWAAGTTFTIYLFHLPVAQCLATLVPWPPSYWATRIVLVGGTLVALFLIAEVTERRKDPWRRLFTMLVNRLSPPAPARP
jgi:peptidoglycan/LPS O-acetylase OafA/YrhL